MLFNQRLTYLSLALLVMACASLGQAAEPIKKHKLLYFTRTVGYEHAVVHCEPGALSLSEQVLTDLCRQAGMELECSKDGRLFDGDLSGYDGFIFFTNGDLTQEDKKLHDPPMTTAGKQKLLDAVAGGKGFVGVHGASGSWRTEADPSDTNQPEPSPYINMLGGEFLAHGPQQDATVRVVSPDFPGVKGFGDSFRSWDEWYSLVHLNPQMHVIMVLETKGMKGPYDRAPYPITWARMQDKGRVFYTALGHDAKAWKDQKFQELLVGAIRWSIGEASCDLTSNFDQVTPSANAPFKYSKNSKASPKKPSAAKPVAPK